MADYIRVSKASAQVLEQPDPALRVRRLEAQALELRDPALRVRKAAVQVLYRWDDDGEPVRATGRRISQKLPFTAHRIAFPRTLG